MEENKTHFFNIENAKKYGVEEAIILENLNFWIEKNRANNKHFYEGKYWTYNSVAAFQKLFPYWKETKIRRILESLENQGVIKKGNFNKSAYDRTAWYSINAESICQKQKMEKAENKNGFNENGEPIPYINTNDKPDNKPKEERAKAPHFQKPEKEEVLKVFQENTQDVKKSISETEKFFDYYDSVGWKIGGKTPMRDWKATVRNWVRRMESYKKPEKSNQGQSKINPVLVCYTWETITEQARKGHKSKQAYIEMWEAIAKRKNQTIKWEVSPWAKQKAE